MQGQGVADPSGGHAPADKRSRLEGSPSSVGGKAPRPKARRKRRGKRKSKAERLANRALKQKQLEEAAVPTGQLAPSIDASANTNEAGSQNPFSSPPPQQYTDFVKANDIQMLQKLLAVASLTAAAQVVHALAQGDKLKLATHAMRQLWQRFTGSTTASVTAENAAAAAQFRAAFSSLSLALQQAELHVAAAAVGSGIPGHSVLPILLDLLGDPAAPIKTNVAKTKSEHERLKQAKLILMNPRSGPTLHTELARFILMTGRHTNLLYSCLPAVKQLQVNPLCRAAFRKEDSVIHAHTLSAVATQLELQTRENVRTIVEKLVQGIWPSARVISFGSSATGLVTRGGDLDLCLIVPTKDVGPSYSKDPLNCQVLGQVQKLLLSLSEGADQSRKFDHMQFTKEARIPVLSFQHTQSAVKCDLVVNNVAAVANSALIRYFVEICSQKSSFKVAVQLIRRWARSRHLDLRGTPGLLSPYGWTILACHFGQQRGLLPAARDFLSGAACGTGGGSVPESLYITPGHVDLLSRDPKYFERQIALHFENASNTQSSGVAKRKSESADRESLAHASALDVAMEFFKYILCDFNTKHEVASLRFDAQDVTTRARCCSRHESEWVLEKVKHPSIRIEDPFEIHRNLGHKLHGKRLTLLQCEAARACMVVSGFGIATKCERVEQFVATGAAEIRSALDAAGGSILSVICQRRDPRLKMEPVLTAPRPLAPLPSKFAHEFVSTAAGVQALASTLAQCQVIGLDAEAFLTPAGTENVALLQFSTGQSFFIVDMLVQECFEAVSTHIKPILENEQITKVVHDCRLEAKLLLKSLPPLQQASRQPLSIRLAGVFDTAVAYALIQQTRGKAWKTVSLSFLLKEYLQVGMSLKSRIHGEMSQHSAATDMWTVRPLSADLRQYAVEDVAYLLQLRYAMLYEMSGSVRNELTKVTNGMCEAGGFVAPTFSSVGSLTPGTAVSGVIDSIADFGVFVFLGHWQPTGTGNGGSGQPLKGLLHKSTFTGIVGGFKSLRVGSVVHAHILQTTPCGTEPPRVNLKLVA